MEVGSNNVKEYLEALPEAILTRLYQSPATCLAIFRLLPGLGKLLIMSMLFKEGPLSTDDLVYWIKPQSQVLLTEALQKLRSLHLIRQRFQTKTIILNTTFRLNFSSALTAGDSKKSFGAPCEDEDKNKVDIAFLDKYASSKWESILHFMVGMSTEGPPGPGVLTLLRHSGLMTNEQDAQHMSITAQGFQFLLQDLSSQIWTLLLEYLNMSSNLQMDPVDVLNFIFMLGSLELGKDYLLSALSSTQVKMLEDLRDFGLVYQRKISSRRFYPTRLASVLTSETSSNQQRSASDSMSAAIAEGQQDLGDKEKSVSLINTSKTGFIILETNFRLYAYTESPLQISVLNLFVHLKARFANMVVGQLTRESVRRAFLSGITAEQIITYITVHAHPQMRKSGTESIIPQTVTDQIKLWQLELDRIQADDGFLYNNFKNLQEYSLAVTYAAELGVLLWQNPSKRLFFVSKEGNEAVVDFISQKLS